MLLRLSYIILIIIVTSCSSKEEKKSHYVRDFCKVEINQDSLNLIKDQNRVDSLTDFIFFQADLVDIKSINSIIEVNLKYTTTDNFTHQILYDTINKAYFNIEVAKRLGLCQAFLDSIKPGYRLMIYDAVRPLQVQQEMWDALDSIPVNIRGRYVSNPLFGSVHNYGAAVDLTIIDNNNNELNMGAGYDDFRPIAFPSKEKYFLENGELTLEQVNNRRFLRRVMRSQKFYNIPSEWWHFNAASRVTVSHRYQRLLDESGNVDWFKVVPPIIEDSIIEMPTGL